MKNKTYYYNPGYCNICKRPLFEGGCPICDAGLAKSKHLIK